MCLGLLDEGCLLFLRERGPKNVPLMFGVTATASYSRTEPLPHSFVVYDDGRILISTAAFEDRMHHREIFLPAPSISAGEAVAAVLREGAPSFLSLGGKTGSTPTKATADAAVQGSPKKRRSLTKSLEAIDVAEPAPPLPPPQPPSPPSQPSSPLQLPSAPLEQPLSSPELPICCMLCMNTLATERQWALPCTHVFCSFCVVKHVQLYDKEVKRCRRLVANGDLAKESPFYAGATQSLACPLAQFCSALIPVEMLTALRSESLPTRDPESPDQLPADALRKLRFVPLRPPKPGELLQPSSPPPPQLSPQPPSSSPPPFADAGPTENFATAMQGGLSPARTSGARARPPIAAGAADDFMSLQRQYVDSMNEPCVEEAAMWDDAHHDLGPNEPLQSTFSPVVLCASTEESSDTRRAFLVWDAADGGLCRLACGEYRPTAEVFVVDWVTAGCEYVDVAASNLGDLVGGMVGLDDLTTAGIDMEWDDDQAAAGCSTPMDVTDAVTPSARAVMVDAACSAGAAASELLDNSCQTDVSPPLNFLALPPPRWVAWAADVKVRTEASATDVQKQSKLVRLPVFLSDAHGRREAIPILDCRDGVCKAQRSASVYRGRAADAVETSQALARKLAEQAVAHTQQLAALEAEHAAALRVLKEQHVDELAAARAEERQHMQGQLAAVGQWKAIEVKQARLQAADQLQAANATHTKQLATSRKRVRTATLKRSNASRTTRRHIEQLEQKAANATADKQIAEAETASLNAQMGNMYRVPQSRVAYGSRTAFTPQTVARDLGVRQHSLNTGASHMRDITRTYSEGVTGDGRSLQLESGNLSTVLRWEKIADCLCMLLEGAELRSCLLSHPHLRLWGYEDLSPDARAVEQFGMGLEWAWIEYQLGDPPDGEQMQVDQTDPAAPVHGTPWTVHRETGYLLGADGLPIVVEHARRIFTPMLEALGPKYAATCDCFLRTCQLYGSNSTQLLEADFSFASVERGDIAVPLIDCFEGLVSDAGGETQKSGGVIETMGMNWGWRHCCSHCLNLTLEKSEGFVRCGASVRQLSSFCRGGNKHKPLTYHMKRIQNPALAENDPNCDQRLVQMYKDVHQQLRANGQFHHTLGGYAADVDSLEESLEELPELECVDELQIDRHSKKGTDVRWRYECETLDDRLLDVAHLLAPAILIEYGTGATYAGLEIDQGTEKTPKNKTVVAALALLVDPEFIYWATHLRFVYTLVYKGAFDEVQYNHHRNAPALAGPSGLPMQWAARLRSAVEEGSRLSAVAKPLVAVLEQHEEALDVEQLTADSAADLLKQATLIEDYFLTWRSLEGLVHAVALEIVVAGPLPSASADDEVWVNPHPSGGDEVTYWDMQPRIPAPRALEAAKLGMQLFEKASPEERSELPGTLAWLLFSPTKRGGSDANAVYDQLSAFSKGLANPATGMPFAYRSWPLLAQVLVDGGAKYCPDTSAQLESLFTGITRQQGASKLHISQQQMSFEARCKKNPTMASITERTIASSRWAEAKALKKMLDEQGFWSCDATVAVNRKLKQKLKEGIDVEDDDDDDIEAEITYPVEKITKTKLERGVRFYWVKWERCTASLPAESTTCPPTHPRTRSPSIPSRKLYLNPTLAMFRSRPCMRSMIWCSKSSSRCW